MSILVPKAHRDGSQIGMAGREWSSIISQNNYTTSSIVNGAAITSGSTGLLVDGRPIITSPFQETDISGDLSGNVVGIRINNLLKATGNYDMNSNKIVNVGLPENNGDVASKLYVDQVAEGIKWKQSVKASSVDLGSPNTIYWKEFEQATWSSAPDGQGGTTYTRTSYGNPGWLYEVDSIGEKLTLQIPNQSPTNNPQYGLNVNTSNLVWNDEENNQQVQKNHPIHEYLFDNVSSFQDQERILVNVFQDASKNGIYVFETTGSSQQVEFQYAKPVLRRASDFNETSEVSSAAVFVEEGSQNADTAFVCTTNNTDIEDSNIGNYNINWSVYGTQAVDGITIYKDILQSDRLEVTGVLRDINDLFYDYGSSSRIQVEDGGFLVGNGNSFVLETSGTARHSLELGSSHSPTFSNLTLSQGALTASHIVSNNKLVDPVIFDSDISGSIDITVANVSIDSSLNAYNVVASNQVTANNGFVVNAGGINVIAGNVSLNNNNITGGGSISANYITASVVMSASYLQLKEYSDQTAFNLAGNSTQNSIYVAGDTLYFDNSPIGGSNFQGGQPIENVRYYGGNITSDMSETSDESSEIYYTRIGVSGSHISPSTSTDGSASHYQILTGSFMELTGSKVKISSGVASLNHLTASSADINGGTIDGTAIANSDITISAGKNLNVAAGNLSTSAAQNLAILQGASSNVDIGNFGFRANSLTADGLTATHILFAGQDGLISGDANFTFTNSNTLNVTNIGAFTAAGNINFNSKEMSNVNITGGSLDNVTIGAGSTINAQTADYVTGIYENLTASNLIVPKTNDDGYIEINVSDNTRVSTISKSNNATLNITASNGIFDVLSGSDVDINAGTLDNIEIGGTQGSSNRARFNFLTSSVVYIEDPNDTNYAQFNVLSASHVEILDPDSTNFAVIQTITGSNIKTENIQVHNQFRANNNSVEFLFSDNLLQNIGTVNQTSSNRKHAVNREYLDKNIAIKTSVKAADNVGVTLTNIDDQSTIDNYDLNIGDRILLVSQTDSTENGIWEVTNQTPNALVRPFDFNTGDPAGAFVVHVENGTANENSLYAIHSTGVIGTDDIDVVKISSQNGISSDGKGLSKTGAVFDVDIKEGDWDTTNYLDRANLRFNGTQAGRTNSLILSQSIRVDELKVVNGNNNEGKILVSGSSDSYIDNVSIGINNPSDAKFNNLTIATGNVLTLEGNAYITGSNGSQSYVHLGEVKSDKLTLNNIITAETTQAGENLIDILGSLKISNTQPGDVTQRIYTKGGDLYFENDRIGFGGGASVGQVDKDGEFTSLFVTGSETDGHGAFISGSLTVDGNVNFRGTTTIISSSNTVIQDSIIGLGITGSDGTEEFNDLGDRGIIFARSANQSDALPGMWWDGSKFNFAKSVTSPSSGSFGSVTEYSKVQTGIVESTSVTASLGLKINDYNMPLADGQQDQIISTDGAGNLTFVDNAGGASNNLKKINMQVTTDPSTTTSTKQTFSIGAGVNPDIFIIDFSQRNTQSTSYAGSSSRLYLTIELNNLSNSFLVENKVFYVGINGFDFDYFQNNPSLALHLGFTFHDDVNVFKRDNNTIYGSTGVITNFVKDNNLEKSQNTGSLKNADWAARFQFTSGTELGGRPYSRLLDRATTNDDKIYCLKFEIVSGGASSGFELSSNFDEIITFSADDTRFI